MAIWQAMKGANENPKQEWICNDLRHQHFSEDTGRRLRKHVKKGDLLLIYFPGRVNRVYMGLQRAAEDGPRVLDLSVPGAVDWPWGLRVEGHRWIPARRLGISLHESVIYFPRRPQIVRSGLAPVDHWGSRSSIQTLIDEIRKRGEDPSTWKTWPRSL